MVVTPFGDLALGDGPALERFLLAHRARHRTYAQAAKMSGGSSLDGPLDADWMYRHAATHVALATLTATDLSGASTKALALPGPWHTEQQLIDWHEIHSRHHLKIDRQLKL